MHDPFHSRAVSLQRTRNVLLDVTCLVIISEIVALLATGVLSWWATGITLAEVVLFLVLSFVAVKNPYIAVFLALAVFIAGSIMAAAAKPSFLGGSVAIKIFILIYLVRSVPDARHAQFALKGEKHQ